MIDNNNSNFKEILDIAEKIYLNPELGYKENNTSCIIEDFIKKYAPDIEITKFAKTGIKFNVGEKKDIHIALVGEMDAVYAPTHFHSNKNTGAAHNCGHYSQVAILLDVFKNLVTTNILSSFDFSIGFVFVPAEEFLDLDFRKNLIENGEISYFGGKPEAIKLGIFDEFDLAICVHSMGGIFEKRSIEINCDLAGFLYKYYEFEGLASHSGFAPANGINAYNISTLFNVALGLYRQQIDEKYLVRINPVVMESNMGTNIIPNKIKIGTDIRAHSTDYMIKLATQLDNMALGSALSLGGKVNIKTDIGYLPFIQNRYLSSFVKNAYEKFDEIGYCKDNSPVSAAGDIGDLSYILPAIQIGYSGFKGTIHGDDFIHEDTEYIFSIFPKFLIEVFKEMNGKIDKKQLYKRTYEEYKNTINLLGGNNEK